MLVEAVEPGAKTARPLLFSERHACPACGVSYPELAPRFFSFNSPHGACPACAGLGVQRRFDPALVVPRPEAMLPDALSSVVVRALPQRMPAASSGTLLVMALGGRDPATGDTFVASELAAGGMGARPRKDGIDAIETDVSNCMNIPVESVEMGFPVRIPRAGLWADSGGAGQFRGGLGLVKVFEATGADIMISHRGERFASAPWGLHGGLPGRSARAFILRRDGRREELPSKQMIELHPGDQLWEYIAGGAGYGDPLERDPAQVLADVLDGKVSHESARETYGVVLVSEGHAVDELGTKEYREAIRRRRGPITWTFDRGVDGRR